MKRILFPGLMAVLLLGLLTACAPEKKGVVFADAGWDSARFHNAIAGFVATHAYGLSWSEVMGSSTVLHEALKKGEVDVHMEVWTDNLASYAKDVKAGELQELGINFDDNASGLYVPRYVIEGDAKRGIAPLAPDLKTVADLKRYSHVFRDDDDKTKGRIYGAIPGWQVDTIMHNKFMYNTLDEKFIYFRPGSDAALTAALTSAYEKGQPVVGYYWEPTWLLGLHDFVLLEDAPYTTLEAFNQGKTECPSMQVAVAASNQFVAAQPAFVEFLKKYKTSSKLTSDALAHMQQSGEDVPTSVKWFLQAHDALLDQWLSADKAALVRAALK